MLLFSFSEGGHNKTTRPFNYTVLVPLNDGSASSTTQTFTTIRPLPSPPQKKSNSAFTSPHLCH